MIRADETPAWFAAVNVARTASVACWSVTAVRGRFRLADAAVWLVVVVGWPAVFTENVAVGCESVVWPPVGAVAGALVVWAAELPPCCVSEPVPVWPPPELGVACAALGDAELVALCDPFGDAA